MAIWNVSRVAPSHASLRAITGGHQTSLTDELGPHIAAEPELALVVMTLVVAIPIAVAWLLRPIPVPGPKTVIGPAVLGDRVAPPKAATRYDLPKAQAPPLELLQYSPGHVASKAY
jgi:hypothetical protein